MYTHRSECDTAFLIAKVLRDLTQREQTDCFIYKVKLMMTLFREGITEL